MCKKIHINDTLFLVKILTTHIILNIFVEPLKIYSETSHHLLSY